MPHFGGSHKSLSPVLARAAGISTLSSPVQRIRQRRNQRAAVLCAIARSTLIPHWARKSSASRLTRVAAPADAPLGSPHPARQWCGLSLMTSNALTDEAPPPTPAPLLPQTIATLPNISAKRPAISLMRPQCRKRPSRTSTVAIRDLNQAHGALGDDAPSSGRAHQRHALLGVCAGAIPTPRLPDLNTLAARPPLRRAIGSLLRQSHHPQNRESVERCPDSPTLERRDGNGGDLLNWKRNRLTQCRRVRRCARPVASEVPDQRSAQPLAERHNEARKLRAQRLFTSPAFAPRAFTSSPPARQATARSRRPNGGLLQRAVWPAMRRKPSRRYKRLLQPISYSSVVQSLARYHEPSPKEPDHRRLKPPIITGSHTFFQPDSRFDCIRQKGAHALHAHASLSAATQR